MVGSSRALLSDLRTLSLPRVTDFHSHNCGRYAVHGRCQRLLKGHIVDMLVTCPLIRRARIPLSNVHVCILRHVRYLTLITMAISVGLKICSVAVYILLSNYSLLDELAEPLHIDVPLACPSLLIRY